MIPEPDNDTAEGCIQPLKGCSMIVVWLIVLTLACGVLLRACEWAVTLPDADAATTTTSIVVRFGE